MPRFSLIVPVYRVEAYLPKCIESVLAQTCQDYELLLIDDGSPDGCGKICDDYAAKYPDKLRAIHQPNGGAGAARPVQAERAPRRSQRPGLSRGQAWRGLHIRSRVPATLHVATVSTLHPNGLQLCGRVAGGDAGAS